MNKSKELEKYQINQQDWKNIDLVNMKMKAESVVSLFLVLENTLAPHISPVESEMIDKTKNAILKYLDNSFIDNLKQPEKFDLSKLNGGEFLKLNYSERKNLTVGKIYEVQKNGWLEHPLCFTIKDDNNRLFKCIRSNKKGMFERVAQHSL